jgi:hypothetical protein
VSGPIEAIVLSESENKKSACEAPIPRETLSRRARYDGRLAAAWFSLSHAAQNLAEMHKRADGPARCTSSYGVRSRGGLRESIDHPAEERFASLGCNLRIEKNNFCMGNAIPINVARALVFEYDNIRTMISRLPGSGPCTIASV